jgi:hypothetical protein
VSSESRARGNGLSAESYVLLADLAPELVDGLLRALRDAGVAAYATAGPSFGAGPAALTASPASAADVALDRVYADERMTSEAEQVLHAYLPRLRETREPPSDGGEDTGTDVAKRDEDAIWAEIVASFDAPAEGTTAPWPEEEDVPEAADDPAGPDGDGDGDSSQDRSGRLPTARVIKPATEEPSDDEFGEDEEEDDEGHFVPPPPPPLPTPDPTTKFAWIALFGGPLYLLAAALLGWQVPGWVAFVAVAAFVGGFVTLVVRMGDDPRDPDDGAVV